MIIHRNIRPYLYQLDEIYTDNRRKHSKHQAYMLYQVLLDFMRHWRHIELTEFDQLSDAAQDELYYFFTEKLLHIFDMHLDLYWLIPDLDGQPLFKNGREPDDFWRKKLDKPEHQLKRFDYA